MKRNPKATLPATTPTWSGRRASLPPRAGGLCPVCGTTKLSENNEEVRFLGGATVREGSSKEYGPSSTALGYLDLTWSRGVPFQAELGQQVAYVGVAQRVRGGQFSAAVCSIRCLRRLFASWADALAEEMRKEKARAGKSDLLARTTSRKAGTKRGRKTPTRRK